MELSMTSNSFDSLNLEDLMAVSGGWDWAESVYGAAVGFVSGTAGGFVTGAVAGAFTGPGVLVSAAVGAFSGAAGGTVSGFIAGGLKK